MQQLLRWKLSCCGVRQTGKWKIFFVEYYKPLSVSEQSELSSETRLILSSYYLSVEEMNRSDCFSFCSSPLPEARHSCPIQLAFVISIYIHNSFFLFKTMSAVYAALSTSHWCNGCGNSSDLIKMNHIYPITDTTLILITEHYKVTAGSLGHVYTCLQSKAVTILVWISH